jgi:hypothetical protein
VTDYVQTPEGRINDLARDLYVLATVARQGRLNVKAADALVERVRRAASDMIEDHDRELLRTAADRLDSLTTRVESAGFRPRTKAAPPVSHPSPPPVAQPSLTELIRQQDREQIDRGGPFDRATFEAVEQARVTEANRQLQMRNRTAEEDRRHRR